MILHAGRAFPALFFPFPCLCSCGRVGELAGRSVVGIGLGGRSGQIIYKEGCGTLVRFGLLVNGGWMSHWCSAGL